MIFRVITKLPHFTKNENNLHKVSMNIVCDDSCKFGDSIQHSVPILQLTNSTNL